jgi:NodT family efflux transporter outer membrane factor (OMF) lipoprotein
VTFWGTAMLHWYDIFSKRSRLLFHPHWVRPGRRGLALILAAATVSLLVACAVGPDYVRPAVEAPDSYKETGDWKQAEPKDHIVRGVWWEIFNNPELNALEEQVNISNQNVAAAEAQFRQALALVQVARAGYFPTLTAGASAARALRSGNAGVGNPGTSGTIINDYLAPLTASWAIDVWGRVRRQVEAGAAGAQASAALLESVRLLTQAQVAQNYFQLRTLDAQKKLLDETIIAYQTSLKLTQNRYASGVSSRADVLQAETLLKSTQAQAIDIGVQRAQLEHAIAVLLGKPASLFSIPVTPLSAVPPAIPVGVPSELLERRPDVATAERTMAAANAQIGVAKAAFFPTVTLNGTAGYESSDLSNWFTWPSRFWSLGAGVSEAVFEGGLRMAQTAAARAAYDATVASYRQTVLTAFQQVEDNLAALRILEGEAQVQEGAVLAARQSVAVALNQYKAGTVSYLAVVVLQVALQNNEITALAIQNRRMIAAVNLIQALGGGWSASELAERQRGEILNPNIETLNNIK